MAEFAGVRHRIIDACELNGLGISSSAIARWVARGRLKRVHHGVYQYGSGELSIEGRLYAAVRAVGNDAVLSHISAAVLLRFWPFAIPSIVDVTVPRRVSSRDRIRVHQVAGLRASAVTTHLGIRVTTPARTILDLAGAMYSDNAFRRVIHEAQVQKKVTLAELQAEVARARLRCPGAARLAAEIADGPKPTRSGFEDWAVELLRRHNFPPFETNVHLAGTPDWVEVDILFPHQKLVIEVDGDRYHATRFRRESDAHKQAIVEAAGCCVIRLGEEDALPAREPQVVARIWDGLRS